MSTFAATSSVDDADIEVDDTKFVRTDHVFRMGNARIEAFSGMAEDLYGLIKDGRVEEYRQAAYELHCKRPTQVLPSDRISRLRMDGSPPVTSPASVTSRGLCRLSDASPDHLRKAMTHARQPPCARAGVMRESSPPARRTPGALG